MGKTGGAKTHTHGDHADHADHNHVLGPNGPLPGGGSYATPTTGGVVGGDASNTLTHSPHSSDDGRPPFTTVVWIKRTS